MKKKRHTTSYDTYANLTRIEKDECAMKVFNTKEALDELNNKIREAKEKINDNESRARGVGDNNGQSINLTEYEIIRLNLHTLTEKVNELREAEKEVKEKYDLELKELDGKRSRLEKLMEKRAEKVKEIENALNKKAELELDDLWGQLNWVKENG